MKDDDESPERRAFRLKLQKEVGDIARVLGQALPPGIGYCVMLFDFGDAGGSLAYAANAKREQMIKVLVEFEGVLRGGN